MKWLDDLKGSPIKEGDVFRCSDAESNYIILSELKQGQWIDGYDNGTFDLSYPCTFDSFVRSAAALWEDV